jgi:hypothetical protein
MMTLQSGHALDGSVGMTLPGEDPARAIPREWSSNYTGTITTIGVYNSVFQQLLGKRRMDNSKVDTYIPDSSEMADGAR